MSEAGWTENSQFILNSINDFKEDLKAFKSDLTKEISTIKVDIATIKTEIRLKSGIYGAIGAAIVLAPTIIVFLINFYSK